MEIRSLHIQGLRAHSNSSYSFSEGVNLLYGPNGIGKTNVLEAIHYACLAKSFLTSSDRFAIRNGESVLQIDAVLGSDLRGDQSIRLVAVAGEGKRVFVNGSQLDRLVDLVGRFPVVVLAPSDHRMTEDGPDERRRFLDTMLCQASPVYLHALVAYRRVLRQRNELLAKSRGSRPEMLGSYDHSLVKHGARLVHRRASFLGEFCKHLESAYSLMATSSERPTISYRSIAPGTEHMDEDETAVAYLQALERRSRDEQDRGLTLVGPHRDDLVFKLDDLLVRRYASQGQHRTFVMALKLAQYFYLANRLGERPVLLLDDVFDTLDPDRMRTITELLTGGAVGQTIVTAARRDVFEGILTFQGDAERAIAISPQSQPAADDPSPDPTP